LYLHYEIIIAVNIYGNHVWIIIHSFVWRHYHPYPKNILNILVEHRRKSIELFKG